MIYITFTNFIIVILFYSFLIRFNDVAKKLSIYNYLNHPNIKLFIDKDESCPICLSKFSDKIDICIPACGHAVHMTCFKDLIKSNYDHSNKCPTCKIILFQHKRQSTTPTSPIMISRHTTRLRINSNILNLISTISPTNSPINY